MSIRTAISTTLLAALAAASPARAQTAASPRFQVDLVAVASAQLPALQSFTLGQGSNGRWLLVGGRTNGLHLFVTSTHGGTTPPPNAFPPTHANQSLWVLEPATRRAWSASVTSLPPSISDALSANNAQSSQAGDMLYVLGGYGWSTQAQSMITFPTLTAIALDETIAAIVAGQPFASYFQQTSTYYDCIAYGSQAYNQCFANYNACPGPAPCPCAAGPGFQACLQQGNTTCLAAQQAAIGQCNQLVRSGQVAGLPTNSGAYTKVAGGGLEMLGDTYVLAFGQDFEGLYSVNEGDYGKWPVNQTYSESVLALSITPKPLAAAALQQVLQDPNDPGRQFHRRDLNVVPGLDTDGKTPIVQALGGVFVPGQDAAYQEPILISGAAPGMTVAVTPFAQRMSQYECAVVPLFDRAAGGGLTDLLFGGISLYYVDEKTGKLKVDSGLPFISAISALARSAGGTWSEFYRVQPMVLGGQPARVGADAKFLRHPAVAAAPNGVIYLDAITTRTLIGWMFGGILAESANPGATNKGTAASSQLFEVWLDPTPPPANYWASTAAAPAVVITPNNDTAKKAPGTTP
jgi:hypothetical protein